MNRTKDSGSSRKRTHASCNSSSWFATVFSFHPRHKITALGRRKPGSRICTTVPVFLLIGLDRFHEIRLVLGLFELRHGSSHSISWIASSFPVQPICLFSSGCLLNTEWLWQNYRNSLEPPRSC